MSSTTPNHLLPYPDESQDQFRPQEDIEALALAAETALTALEQRVLARTTPTGSLVMTAAAQAPEGWLMCRGQTVSRTTYAALFDAIGTTYGSGNGTSSFKLPDLSGRSPLGAGTGTATGATSHQLGALEGEEKHTLTAGELAVHSHGIDGYDARFAIGSGPGSVAIQPTATRNWREPYLNGDALPVNGGDPAGQPHNNLGPSTVVNFMIKT